MLVRVKIESRVLATLLLVSGICARCAKVLAMRILESDSPAYYNWLVTNVTVIVETSQKA